MVFESIVVDVLNRFLGDYVENLNHKQLKLGIWGGDVVLENLVLKQNALEELSIPVQTVYGHLGKLILKIPWKNLYGASVEATIEGLYLVVNPNAEVKYDPEKEEKIALEGKQAELARVEEAKKREAEKEEGSKIDETFVEKLVTQIIKNVQLTIRDIHVRYEDSITNPSHPFSLGITLHNLSVHTTDENWQRAVIQEAVTKIFKILSLEGLAIYWNPKTELYAKLTPDTIKTTLKSEIATKLSTPQLYQYVLGPINATAKLKLNPKPEADVPKFSIPKVTLMLHMETLSVSLSKGQYRDMMLLVDSMDRMRKAAPYRKYRPDLKIYRGHYKQWWKFAYKCILEEEVLRKRRNWDWKHMLQHRQLCKDYASAYQNKLINKGKVSSDQQAILNEAEKKLDLLNIVVIRQRIEMEVERLGKLQAEAQKTRGWFSGWWSGANSQDGAAGGETDIVKQFQNAMTPEEKAKLFRAIDYQENSAPLHLPVEYVAVKGEFKLDTLKVTLTDEQPVLTTEVAGVCFDLYQRPSANAIRCDVQMHTFTVTGARQGLYVPHMVVSKEVAVDVHLLNIMFETNPIDKSCDQRVKVTARPLQIVYDALTVIRIVEVFKPPEESTALTTLQAAAENKLSDLKEKSALSMQYAVQQHTVLDIDVDVAASHIVIPQTGQYNGNEQCIVIKLGAITLKTAPRAPGGPLDVAKLFREGLDDKRVLLEIAKHSYDRISLGLTQIQIVVAKVGEDWMSAISTMEGTNLHLLQPTNLIIQIHKCLIQDDPRLPKFKIRGELEKIAVSISQDRLLSLCEILVSMPLPESPESTQLKITLCELAYLTNGRIICIDYLEGDVIDESRALLAFEAKRISQDTRRVIQESDKQVGPTSESKASSLSLLTKYLDPVEKQKRESARTKKKKGSGEPTVQLTEVETFFILKEVSVCVKRSTLNKALEYEKFLDFGLNFLELTVTQKTFNLEAMVRLGAVTLKHHREGCDTVCVIETPGVVQRSLTDNAVDFLDTEYLFTITYCNVDKKCPEFHSAYGSVEQLIQLRFSKLKVLLHLESLQEIMQMVNSYQTRLQQLQSMRDRVADAGPLETIQEEDEPEAITKSRSITRKTDVKKQVESIQIKVIARLETVEIEFATNQRPLSLVALQGAHAALIVKASYTELKFTIASLFVKDLNSISLHKDILKVVGGDVLQICVVLFNRDHFPTESDVDISVEATLNTLKIFFLNWFVTSMLDFLNNFQTAQQAIAEASAQAAEVARERAAQAYQNSTKVLLTVKMAAPIIVIPENSTSMKALIIDLGRLNIKNSFVTIPVEESARMVMLDELTLELEDMQVSCAALESGGDGWGKDGLERKLLAPTTFTVLVRRSLSAWHTATPDLDVSGRIDNVTISIGESDYKSIMRILQQNLQEGQNKKIKSDTKVTKTTSKSTVKSQPLSRIQVKSTAAVVEPTPTSEKKDNEPIRTTIKFSFSMHSFVIVISTNERANDNASEELAMPRDTQLAQLCLRMLTVQGRMLSDGSMHTTLMLVDCTMDDTRPNRGTRITRYLERRRPDQEREAVDHGKDSTAKIRSMIDITYTMKNNDTFIDMRIFSFNLILAMDFLNKLAEFMTSGFTEAPLPSDIPPDSRSNLLAASPTTPTFTDEPPERLLGAKRQLSVVSKIQTDEKEPVQPAKPSMMTVNLKIEQPDIILVESLEDKNCEAFVLNMEVRFKLRQTAERKVADGGISSLQIVTRKLGVAERGAREEPRYLLAPTHMSLAVSQPPGSGMHVDIAITDIKITVSPDVIALMNRVLATMSSTEDEDLDRKNIAAMYPDLWAMKPLRPNSYWFFRTEEAREALEDELALEVAQEQPPVGEICLLSSPSIVLSFQMNIGQETIPVLVMQASLQGQVKDWSSDFHMESTWAMQISYYNIARAEWEPLVEPVEVMRDCHYRHEPWELKIEMSMRAGEQRAAIDTTDEGATNKAVAMQQPNKTIAISSSSTLEITITRTGMEVLTLLANSLSQTEPSSSVRVLEGDQSSNMHGAPYVLHNCTGLTAKLLLKENKDFTVYLREHKSKVDYSEVLVEPGASVPLQLKRAGFGQLKLNEPPPELKLKVEIVEMEEVLSIPVERADKRYFSLGRGGTGAAVTGSTAGLELGWHTSQHDQSGASQTVCADTSARGVPYVAAFEPRGLISDIVMQAAAVHIYLRSVLQVKNTLSVNVSVYYMTRCGNEVQLLGDVKPGDTLRLPLQAVYTPTAEIFFSVEDFTVSVSPFVWRELQQEVNLTKLLHCDSKNKTSGEKFYFKAVGKMEQVFFENTSRQTFASSCYDVVLKPAVKLQNCLPVPIVVSQLGLQRTRRFEPGEMFHLSHLAPNWASIVVMIENYLDKCWVCTKNLPDEQTELSVWSFESHDSPSVMTLDLGMHNVDEEGTQVLSLYCPFWMINKTGFTLSYRKSKKPEKENGTPNKKCNESCAPECMTTSRIIDPKGTMRCITIIEMRENVDETGNVIFHPRDYHEPILFSFRAKNFFGKKNAAIRLEFGEWSDKFSLDVPGSSGVVDCKLEGRNYQVVVQNQLTFNSLTKMVIFTPFFLIINEAPFAIQYQELHRSADPWQAVPTDTVAPLWPAIEKEDKLLRMRVVGCEEICAPFLYTEQHSTCLKLDNPYGGLHVDVSVSEDGTRITVQQYRAGHAPALLVNYTHHTLQVLEKENVNVRKIKPMHEMLYAWDNPAGPQKLIIVGYKNEEVEIEIRQDGIGEFMATEHRRHYWVSFLDGLQRVVLITSDILLARGAHMVGDSEIVDTEMVLSMQGLGLSLVDDHRMQEIVYVSMSNSGIIWEQCKIGARRYKKVDAAKAMQLEEAYQRYLAEKMVSDTPIDPIVQVNKLKVDFEEMRVVSSPARLLRRTLEPGLWASYGRTAHSARIHARMHRLQVDQQLPLPTFPVVLAPVPPPRSVALTGMKPFIEVSIVERMMENTKVRQYKYFKVLIQEFHVKVDMGLISALMVFFPQQVLTEKEALEAFNADLEKAKLPLESLAIDHLGSGPKNFYDNLHLSPLKVHVSFSLGGATHQLPTFVGTVLQSIGVTLTDMNDVVFKLSYYERTYEFLSQKELVSQVQAHYVGQALKQLYVLVLGLDVIGNPYGLVVGLKKGVEDLFYEPFQGAIQGPGEFAEGLFLGVRSLVGHTVGGAAGAVSRITGAMGHGLAALSLDEDYQRRRRDNMNKPPANIQEGFARSGKGLVMGVVDGVTGVFTKPFEGARDDGVEGFFKGLGRGAVGLVARPTAGVVDFASGSLDAVKRAADWSEDVNKQRAARYLPIETGVRPYSRSKAEGYKMLFELDKGKYLQTDKYQAHVWVVPGKEVAMCTDKRLLYLEKNQVFGGWQIVWSYLWTEIPEPPSEINKSVYIPTAKKKILGMFSSHSPGKLVFLYDEQQRKYFLAQCERLMSSAG